MDENKTVMMNYMGRVYVGNPVFESVPIELREGEDKVESEMIVEIKNAYEFIPIPMTVPRDDGRITSLCQFVPIKVGTITGLADCLVAELANDSPYYKDYVQVMTGIRVESQDKMPERRHRGH